MTFWTQAYISRLLEFMRRTITAAQYRVNDVWYAAEINDITIDFGQLQLLVHVPANGAEQQAITGVRLCMADDVAGAQDCTITRAGAQNLLLKFELPLVEV